mmetsp:Transcript_53467/g.116563  ORF Transcript_53467/g.116563 Transcript_53467/m.116563 type:complete len:226 (+) Transcript_53467:789-1466(+)
MHFSSDCHTCSPALRSACPPWLFPAPRTPRFHPLPCSSFFACYSRSLLPLFVPSLPSLSSPSPLLSILVLPPFLTRAIISFSHFSLPTLPLPSSLTSPALLRLLHSLLAPFASLALFNPLASFSSLCPRAFLTSLAHLAASALLASLASIEPFASLPFVPLLDTAFCASSSHTLHFVAAFVPLLLSCGPFALSRVFAPHFSLASTLSFVPSSLLPSFVYFRLPAP